MPEITDHKAYTPGWIDLASPNIAATTSFYGQLFGWEAQQIGGPEMGNYTFLKLNGRDVGAVSDLMNPDQPSAWNIYFISPNIDQTAEAVRAAGGSVMMAPDDVPNAGRIGFFGDPSGAAFGVWQPREHKGMGVVRENGAFAWTELQTRDMAAAKPFYQKVFGWGVRDNPMGPGQPDYTEWKVDGDSIGGGMPMQPMVPAEVPSHWLVYFGVSSADTSAVQVTQLGGRVLAGPMDFPGGRFAVVADPHGAPFGLLEMRS